MYPPQYIPKFDLKKANDNGDNLSATELYAELSDCATSLNQAIQFIRSITTANMKIKPSQISGTTFVISDEQTATAAQTDIYFQNSVTISPTLSTVGVFIAGIRLPDSQVTLFSDHVEVTPALTSGQNIVLEIHDNAASVFNDLASVMNALGASLVGIEDTAGFYAAANVEEALAEVHGLLNDFMTAVGDLTKYLKADVAVPLEVNQDAAGFTWKNLAPAVDANDPVILSQVTSLLSILSNLAGTFLPLTGGVMQGPLNMGSNRIVNLPAPSANKDAAPKEYVDAFGSQLGDFIPSAGEASLTRAAQAVITGSLNYNQIATTNASNPQGPTATVPTLYNLPRPTQPGDVVNLQKLTEVETLLQAQISTISGSGGGDGGNKPDGSVSNGSSLGGCVLDGTGLGSPVPDINLGGIYNFAALTVVAAQTPAEDTSIFSNGNIAINNNISMANKRLEISTSGNITIDVAATITCHSLTLRAGGTITIDGVIIAVGDVRPPDFSGTSAGNAQGRGVAGFVYCIAGGAINTGNASAITTCGCYIFAGASSVHQGTITGHVTDGGSRGEISVASNDGGSGSYFGRDIGFLLGGLYVGSQNGPTLNEQEANSFKRDTYYAFVPYRYAGEPGLPVNGGADAGGGGAGGTAGGDGGDGDGAAGTGGDSFMKNTYRPYLYQLCAGGGGGGGAHAGTAGERGGRAGGIICIYIIGDLTATGSTYSVNGQSGQIGGGGTGSGGGGAGAARAVATGNITDGTMHAVGGDGRTSSSDGGGGGGGGGAHFIASAFAGTQSLSVAGGTASSGGVAGSAGTSGAVVIAQADILCLATEGYWSR